MSGKPPGKPSGKPEQLEILIKEDMRVTHRAELVARLEEETGIVSAWFEHGDHHRLTVNFEPDHFSALTLLDTIRKHGLHGEIAGDR